MPECKCDCECHTDKNIMHFEACCEGECIVCGKPQYSMKYHLRESPGCADRRAQAGKPRHKEAKPND